VMLEVKEETEGREIKAAVEGIIEHHDALRLRFRNEEGVMEGWNAGREESDRRGDGGYAGEPGSGERASDPSSDVRRRKGRGEEDRDSGASPERGRSELEDPAGGSGTSI